MVIVVENSERMSGEVEVSSSKNAILPILAASLLSDEAVLVNKVPEINDVCIIKNLINSLGVKVEESGKTLRSLGMPENNHPPYELVRQIRASFLVMGPLLATKGMVRISFPGGCAIGNRPIDLHLKGFQALGARINLSCGDVIASATKLKGNHIYLDYPSVGATENILMAASMAEGRTYIENAALEPEVVDLANFINSMGGKISGAGSNVIKVDGVKKMTGTNYTPIPDRIEAGTYMVAAAATAGNIVVKNVIPEHLKAVIAKLIESGAEVEENKDQVRVNRTERIKPIYIKTLPYPGFPTDMQAQFMAYLSRAEGSSVVTESVFENRFMHVQELLRMGAKIKTEGRTAIIKGIQEISGASVIATDLRAGAALLIAGLTAEGSTIISESEHIDRGYEKIVEKLSALGARISRA
ncbi:MAG: UDP-N-acetylglucosamine 1-carboxyvinyltransferase [Syntrophomonas sp.]|uniref:UDP-N-acetylglucosamine 1-carboxyvinyltransferase n=1 Tax=Syntrophomonas sp. TaxID=2053627 RepID=UPI00262B7BA5|nr:UDP-N-acetylglucosamine 1-carboxyvinyltransferase [Syntrophomonas sp.]MDD2509545.1 UDP-N-acetylglucosamine 1-carboxyvinyltransferase [Syntrophomonas sp.]MDD3878416.1 UDP-N-acetylglucosamine 1-carboxyvinyltransferase [Syntrophomonas sp.]MDD4625485.1 UDP-N-acetylglucosamine 1-carboxyvinyltransferase [Syntrophomonas sp.]